MSQNQPTDDVAVQTSTSPWAPFRRRAFLFLWIGVVVSSIGSWAQNVGAQWLFVNDPHAATIVPLVQTASTLPMLLLALPAGVLADAFDRRWLLFGVQVYSVVVALLLFVLTRAGQMTPVLLLGFTFAVGAGMALLTPTWQALIAELVPRSQIAAATRLDMVSVNVSRAVGPAIAGLVIAAAGVAPVFAMNAGCTLVLVAVLLAWRRPKSAATAREPFLPAIRAGGRYVRHEPVVRLILLRLVAFIAPATALWALLPLIAHQQLGLSAAGYGVMFAALGLGAVIASFSLARVKQHLSSNALLGWCAVLYGVALAVLVLVPHLAIGLVVLVLAGFCWNATVATINSELQLFLPGWVRGRALAIYLMTFLGSQAFMSPVWGQVVRLTSLPVAVLVAAALVGLGVLAARWRPIPESESLDRAPLSYWGHERLAIDPEPHAGPVIVSVEYDVAPAQQAGFLDAMEAMRRSRMRSGAFRWELYRVAEQPSHFVEQFAVGSWQEHERQHAMRLTVEDQQIEQAAFAFSDTPRPASRHLVPPGDVGSAGDA